MFRAAFPIVIPAEAGTHWGGTPHEAAGEMGPRSRSGSTSGADLSSGPLLVGDDSLYFLCRPGMTREKGPLPPLPPFAGIGSAGTSSSGMTRKSEYDRHQLQTAGPAAQPCQPSFQARTTAKTSTSVERPRPLCRSAAVLTAST